MSITIGDTVTTSCQPIRAGTVIRLFDLHCATTLLPPAPVNPHEHRLTKASEKADYIAFEQSRQLYVCDKPNFAKKHFLRRMQVKRMPKCPWFEHDAAIYKVEVVYNEATSPFNGINSPTLAQMEQWASGSIVNNTYTTESVNAPWAELYESDGIGQCQIKVEQIDPDPDNTCGPTSVKVTATLNRFGRAYDTLTGGTIIQEQVLSCEDWRNGGDVFGFWSGVAFPVGPIGLVMSLQYTVTGGQGYVG